MGTAGLVFCVTVEEKQVQKKNQNKLPFTWLLCGIGLSAGHQCFSEVLSVPSSSVQFSAFSCNVSAGNPFICLEQPPISSVPPSTEVDRNFKCCHEKVTTPTWGKLGSRAVLLAEADTKAWILRV